MSLTFTLCLTLAVALSPAQQPLTIEKAVQDALRHNPEILAADTGVEIKRQDASSFPTDRWPRISTSIQVGPLLNKAGITFSQGILGNYPGTGPIPATTTTIPIPRSLGDIHSRRLLCP